MVALVRARNLESWKSVRSCKVECAILAKAYEHLLGENQDMSIVTCPGCGGALRTGRPVDKPSIVLKSDQHRVTHNGCTIKITKGQFAIVEQLVNCMGQRNLTAEDLLDRIYQLTPDPPMPKTLVVQMSKANKQLGKIGLHIKNTFAAGYYIEAEKPQRKHSLEQAA